LPLGFNKLIDLRFLIVGQGNGALDFLVKNGARTGELDLNLGQPRLLGCG
jgi:hypothetical protein